MPYDISMGTIYDLSGRRRDRVAAVVVRSFLNLNRNLCTEYYYVALKKKKKTFNVLAHYECSIVILLLYTLKRYYIHNNYNDVTSSMIDALSRCDRFPAAQRARNTICTDARHARS